MSGKIGDNVYRASGVVATAAAAAGGVSWQAVETGATFTAVAGNGYPVNTTAQACTVTLPASASVGDEIIFTDYARKWGVNALTINPNSLNYQGNSSPNPVYDTAGESIHIVYQDATKGWIPTYDGAVALETAQTYTSDWLIIAGGGGGGNGYGGGGGGGGYRSSYDSEASGADSPAEPNITLTEGEVYTVTVGAGGTATSGTTANGVTGDDSSLSGPGITTITSAGGGGGMYTTGGDPGQAGGSGGGSQTPGTGGAGTATQGKDGGDSSSPAGHGGTGGGGATVEPPTHTGGVGTPGQDGIGGGDGQTSTIIGASTVYAGGGGGAGYWWASRGVGGAGGDGGGGDGGDTHNPAVGPSAPNEPDPGIANRGGGGGSGYEAASGGSGAVILRMADANYTGTTTGSPTVATDVGGSGETTLLFTATGTYTA